MATNQATVGLQVADLQQGKIAYRTAGPVASSQPPVVFVHGVLVDARLWDSVADSLASQGIRSYAPTLPLGAHQWPMNPDADLSPRGVARLILDFITALDLNDVTIVGNDTGGAICQILLGSDTSRIGAAVLTDCDAFGAFPPRGLAPLFQAMRHPAVVASMVPGLRLHMVRHGPLAYGPLSSSPLDGELTRAWVAPLARRDIRRDLAKLARGVHPDVLLDAASRFSEFTGPVRILWGEDDRFFPLELGSQLRDAFPRATLTTVPGGRTFLPLDHPGDVVTEIRAAASQAAPRAQG